MRRVMPPQEKTKKQIKQLFIYISHCTPCNLYLSTLCVSTISLFCLNLYTILSYTVLYIACNPYTRNFLFIFF